MKKLFSLILCVIMAFSALAISGCADNSVGKAWEVKPITYDGENGDAVLQRVGFSVTRKSANLAYIWINVESIKGNSVEIAFQKYTVVTSDGGKAEMSPTTGTILGGDERIITAEQVREANSSSKGWIKVNATAWDKSYTTVLMSLEGNIVIREVVFVDMDGKRLDATIDKANVMIEFESGRRLQKTFTAAELSTITDAKYGLPTALVDSQESFDGKDA
ncbi:MAG: hypothetical protein IJY84_05370 [Clostridia bacterium]|nr:hypothetical protein [Clostridia bacterium]